MKLNAYKGGVDSSILVRYTRWARNEKKKKKTFRISVYFNFNFNLVIAIAVFCNENLRYTCMNLRTRRFQLSESHKPFSLNQILFFSGLLKSYHDNCFAVLHVLTGSSASTAKYDKLFTKILKLKICIKKLLTV